MPENEPEKADNELEQNWRSWRKAKRFTVVGISEPVVITMNPPLIDERHEGTLLDISSGGMRVFLPTVIPRQFRFRLEFRPAGMPHIDAEGRTAWLSRKDDGTVEAGVAYTQIDPATSESIEHIAHDFNYCDEKRAAGVPKFCVAACHYRPICHKPDHIPMPGEPAQASPAAPATPAAPPQVTAAVEKTMIMGAASKPAPIATQTSPAASAAEGPKAGTPSLISATTAASAAAPAQPAARSKAPVWFGITFVLLLAAGGLAWKLYWPKSSPTEKKSIIPPMAAKFSADTQNSGAAAALPAGTTAPAETPAAVAATTAAAGWHSRGIEFKKSHDYSAADGAFKQALVIDPKDAMSMYQIATLYGLMGDPPNASKWLAKAVEINETLAATASNDQSFDPIRSSADFRKIIAGR